jgi:hypothetical protein
MSAVTFDSAVTCESTVHRRADDRVHRAADQHASSVHRGCVGVRLNMSGDDANALTELSHRLHAIVIRGTYRALNIVKRETRIDHVLTTTKKEKEQCISGKRC